MRATKSWWGAQSPRRQGVIRYAGPLAAFAVLIALVWLYRHDQGVATRHAGRTLLLRVGFVLALAGAILLLFERRWLLQQLGLLALLFGIAGLFVRVIGQRGPQPVHEGERDLIQALLDVGSVTVAVAVLVYAIGQCSRWWQRLLVLAVTAGFVVLYART